MKSTLFTIMLVVVAIIVMWSGNACATIYTLTPPTSDLGDLPHAKAILWRMQQVIPANEIITGAWISIDDLNNWAVEPDIMYIRLINTSLSAGVTTYTDNEASGDYFNGQGILLTTYSDTNEKLNNKGVWWNPAEDWSYTFTSSQIETLRSYMSDSRFALAFDPDCHYNNNGVSFNIETRTAPEPATMMLVALGLGALGLKPRRR